MRRTIVLSLAIAALFASSAAASIPSGSYTGHWGKHASAKVTFKVSGSYLKNFYAFVPAFCFEFGQYQYNFVSYAVPKAKISGGKVKTTYVIRNSKGMVLGKDKLTATFNGGNVKGTLGGSYTNCTIATYGWVAHH